jgi:hypothetical protein
MGATLDLCMSMSPRSDTKIKEVTMYANIGDVFATKVVSFFLVLFEL